MFKELKKKKKTMLQEAKEHITTMFHQIKHINKNKFQKRNKTNENSGNDYIIINDKFTRGAQL